MGISLNCEVMESLAEVTSANNHCSKSTIPNVTQAHDIIRLSKVSSSSRDITLAPIMPTLQGPFASSHADLLIIIFSHLVDIEDWYWGLACIQGQKLPLLMRILLMATTLKQPSNS